MNSIIIYPTVHNSKEEEIEGTRGEYDETKNNNI